MTRGVWWNDERARGILYQGVLAVGVAGLGWLLVSGAGFFILSGLTLAGFILATARKLSKRRSHTFCMVLACVECVFLPVGTMLGIFTIIVLNRSSVRQLFAAN